MAEQYNPESYWDEVAGEISNRQDGKVVAGDDEPYYRYKRRRFLEVLGTIDFSGKSVLEVGCGPGGNLEFLYNQGCREITGADISQRMVRLASQLLTGKGIDVVKTNGAGLPFGDKQFDLVFTSTVLQHNTHELALQQLVAEICRVAGDEVLLFERIEKRITGHESNMGRPIRYYETALRRHDFKLVECRGLPIQASYLACGVIRKSFNKQSRKEGEPPSKISVILEKAVLPLTIFFDRVIPSKRDVMLLRFKRLE